MKLENNFFVTILLLMSCSSLTKYQDDTILTEKTSLQLRLNEKMFIYKFKCTNVKNAYCSNDVKLMINKLVKNNYKKENVYRAISFLQLVNSFLDAVTESNNYYTKYDSLDQVRLDYLINCNKGKLVLACGYNERRVMDEIYFQTEKKYKVNDKDSTIKFNLDFYNRIVCIQKQKCHIFNKQLEDNFPQHEKRTIPMPQPLLDELLEQSIDLPTI